MFSYKKLVSSKVTQLLGPRILPTSVIFFFTVKSDETIKQMLQFHGKADGCY